MGEGLFRQCPIFYNFFIHTFLDDYETSSPPSSACVRMMMLRIPLRETWPTGVLEWHNLVDTWRPPINHHAVAGFREWWFFAHFTSYQWPSCNHEIIVSVEFNVNLVRGTISTKKMCSLWNGKQKILNWGCFCQYGFMSQFIEGIEPIYIEYLVHARTAQKLW